jgi:hypothetical protein
MEFMLTVTVPAISQLPSDSVLKFDDKEKLVSETELVPEPVSQ